jgi:hypothetical protein
MRHYALALREETGEVSWRRFYLRPLVLPCTALLCTALHCSVLHCTALHCTALHCICAPTAPRLKPRHHAILHCSALLYSTLRLSRLLYDLLSSLFSTLLYSALLCAGSQCCPGVKSFTRPDFGHKILRRLHNMHSGVCCHCTALHCTAWWSVHCNNFTLGLPYIAWAFNAPSCIALQCSAVQCSAVQCSPVQRYNYCNASCWNSRVWGIKTKGFVMQSIKMQ